MAGRSGAADREWLAARGLEGVADVDPFNYDTDRPVLTLGDGWGPGGFPSIELVREAVDFGCGVYLGGSAFFDLEWLGDSLSRLTWLWCPGDVADLGHADLLSEAVSLEWLVTPRDIGVVDLSGLPNLAFISTDAEGAASALNAPNLRRVAYFSSRIPVEVALSSTVESLILEVNEIDLAALGDTRNVRKLSITGARSLDLGGLAGWRSLEDVRFVFCGRVTGLRTLTSLPHLEKLRLEIVGSVDEPEALLDTTLNFLLAEDVGGIDEAFARVADRRPGWTAVIRPPRKSRDRVEVRSVTGEDAAEVVFADWGWLAALLGTDDRDQLPTSSEVEDLLRRVVESSATKAVKQAIEFDSEGDAVIAILPTRRAANQLKKLWIEYLADEDTVRAALE